MKGSPCEALLERSIHILLLQMQGDLAGFVITGLTNEQFAYGNWSNRGQLRDLHCLCIGELSAYAPLMNIILLLGPLE